MLYDSFTRSKVPKTCEKTRNAYMLIYQRQVPQPLHKPEEDQKREEEEEKETQGCHALIDRVWEDNMRFLNEKKLFDPVYFSFIWDLADPSAPSDPSATLSFLDKQDRSSLVLTNLPPFSGLALRTTQLATVFFLEVVAHAKDCDLLPRFADRLLERYHPL